MISNTIVNMCTRNAVSINSKSSVP